MLRFVANGDQKKFTKSPRHSSMLNSQANSREIHTKVFWRAGKFKVTKPNWVLGISLTPALAPEMPRTKTPCKIPYVLDRDGQDISRFGSERPGIRELGVQFPALF